MCVLAGAGTGKTRTITHRIAHSWSAARSTPRQVLAVTFTARAAGEMRGRLRALGVDGVQARTFHAAALRQLRYFWPRVVGGEPPNVAPSKAPLVGEAAARLRVRADGDRDPRPRRRDRVGQGLADHARGLPRGAASGGPRRRRDLDRRGRRRVYAGYEALKRDAGCSTSRISCCTPPA